MTWYIVVYLLGMGTIPATKMAYEKYAPQVRAWLDQVWRSCCEPGLIPAYHVRRLPVFPAPPVKSVLC